VTGQRPIPALPCAGTTELGLPASHGCSYGSRSTPALSRTSSAPAAAILVQFAGWVRSRRLFCAMPPSFMMGRDFIRFPFFWVGLRVPVAAMVSSRSSSRLDAPPAGSWF